ncbi:MAG: tetratricopeptide repeat protein [Bacteroidota bacterium]
MRPAPLARRAPLAALVLGAVVVLAGCRTGSPLHERYNNFRAYYNAYYNASRVMEEGERQLDRPDQVLDRTRLVSIFPEGTGGRGAQFEEAIEKSSELLRNRATSKWADDALFIIGKSYFYQSNVVGAEQKFRETIEVAEARDNDRLADEARLWLGRTLGLAQRYDEGAAVLQERLAQAEGNRRDEARLRLVLGELFARAERYDEAARALRAGVGDERDADTAARAFLLLGQVEEERGQFDAAAEAYRDASARRPAYELGYAADLSRALVLGLDAPGRAEEGLDLIRRMRRDDKNYDHRAEVELARGRILARAGQEQEAVEAMRAVLYDPLLQGGSLRGEAHTRLAEFYRDVRVDFVRASAHLDTAATAIRAPSGTEQNLTRAALVDVPRTAAAFNAYTLIANRLAEADSLLELGMLDADAFAARIEEIEARRLEEFREEQRRLAQTRTQQEFAGGASEGGFRQGSANRAPSNPAAVSGGAAQPNAGFLNFRDRASVQANLLAFQRVWGDRPLVPNWRRQSAIEATAFDAETGDRIDPSTITQGLSGAGPPPLDLSPIPRTEAAQVELRTERASLRYEAANALFLSLGRPDSAATLYRLALEDGGPPEVSRQIRFALAEVEAGRERTAEAEVLYREIIAEAPESPLADAARLRLGLAVRETEDVEDPTSRAYERARDRWREGSYATAVTDFLALAADTSRTEEAPRALLAAASAYVEWARRDSLDLLQPLPESVIPEGLFPEEPAAPVSAPTPQRQEEQPRTTEERTGVSPRVGAIPEELEVPQRDVSDDQPFDAESFDDEITDEEMAAIRRAMQDDEEPDVSRRPAFIPDTPPVREETTDPSEDEIQDLDSEPAPQPVVIPAPTETPAEIETEEPAAPTVDDVLALVTRLAPGTPYARRAAALRGALAPEPDTPDEGAEAESGAPDGFVFGLEGEIAIDPAAGGFTWRAQQIPSPLAVAVTLNALSRRGIRAGVIRDGDGFRLIVGQFESRPEAFGVRADLPTEVEAANASIIPLDGLEVLSADDLETLEE